MSVPGKTPPAANDGVHQACTEVLAVRFLLNAMADAARGDTVPEPFLLDWLSDRLSDAVGMIEGDIA